MATESAKAGDYELLASEYVEHNQDGSTVRYTTGDVAHLSAEQAERLTTGVRPAFGKPGEAERQRAEALQAEADAAKARAEAADEKVVEVRQSRAKARQAKESAAK